MHKPKVKEILLKASDSIRSAMRVIDRGGIGTAFAVDDKHRIVGSVTDGDIRKAILEGLDVKQPVSGVMNHDPVLLYETELVSGQRVRGRVNKLLARSGANIYMPIVNSDRILKKLVLCSQLGSFEGGKLPTKHKGGNSVLVVGGAGYLGSILCRKLLKLGFRVKVLDLLLFGRDPVEPLLEHRNFELIEGDMRDISTVVRTLRDVNAVINLAAIVGDPACKKQPERTIETNYLANKLLAEACRYHQINRFIYASTCSVYGVGDGKLDENAPLNPVSLYARSKIHSEDGIFSLLDENFSPCILRMSTLYGLSPRMRFDLVVNTMTMKAVAEGAITVLGGKQWRPLLHISDAADAYIRCLKAPIEQVRGEVFNVGTDEQNHRIIDIGKMVKAGVPNSKLVIKKDSLDPRDYIVSFTKIRRQFGFRSRMDVRAAVREIRQALESGRIKDIYDNKYYNVWEANG